MVTFDLGGVLVDWNPRYLYRELLDTEDEVERFLTEVCSQRWNEKQDAGRPVGDAVEELSERFPDMRVLIGAYYERFDDMIAGLIDDNVELARELSTAGVPLYALTNWSAETFAVVGERFDILDLFAGIVVSGREGVKKPDPRIYALLLERFSLVGEDVLFIDDSPANVAGARDAGLDALHYRRGMSIRGDVVAWLDA